MNVRLETLALLPSEAIALDIGGGVGAGEGVEGAPTRRNEAIRTIRRTKRTAGNAGVALGTCRYDAI